MRIPLPHDKFAIVDEIDNDLGDINWLCSSYAMRYTSRKGGQKQKIIHMHTIILERKLGRKLRRGEFPDHRDLDRLNNTRRNLRVATRQQNNCNRSTYVFKKSSSYKGVSWFKRDKNWMAYIKHNGKRFYLGYFSDEILAAKAYDEAARLYFGDYAKLNFPEDTEEIMKF
jgi:hypothetical protein